MKYHILEVANTHGGSLDYVLKLIDEFAEFSGSGMKFQPLHPDKIATPDFAGYPIYETLVFTSEQWREILTTAHKTKEVWLDLFDEYSIQILDENRDLVKGVKLQASVLNNYTVIDLLAQRDLKNVKLIINVSGFTPDEVAIKIGSFTHHFSMEELILEVGFQSYPTALEDAGLQKIGVLKSRFPHRLVFADHADEKSEDSQWLPIVAALNGADLIEKHIRHSTLEAVYDHYSSMNISQYRKFIDTFNNYLDIYQRPFITPKEIEYLQKSIQIPILKHAKRKGELVSLADFEFKRTARKGLNVQEIQKLQAQMHCLAADKAAGETMVQEDFKKATVAVIIACRLKSSRLPRKAVLNIGELPSVERCIKSCLQFQNVNHVVLATSTLEEDAELQNYLFRDDVIFHKGDPDDVIRRYLDITETLKVDVVVRVTADNPFVDAEITAYLLKKHFEAGADYTGARESSIGTAAEIINVCALKEIKEHFPAANYSEYMTWYFQNNPEHFRLNVVDLPAELKASYRLTLDYPEDLEMYNAIEKHFAENNSVATARGIFKYLDEHPEVAKINGHLTLKYKTDAALIELLNNATRITKKGNLQG